MDGTFLNSTIGGMKSIPLISFHTIIDEDLACLKYAILDIGINPSFNLDSIKSKTFYNIVYDVYMRKYKNPLYYIKSDNANIELSKLQQSSQTEENKEIIRTNSRIER